MVVGGGTDERVKLDTRVAEDRRKLDVARGERNETTRS